LRIGITEHMALPVFDALTQGAHRLRWVAEASSMQAYADANAAMLDSIDLLFAVWDGVPSAKTGGTAVRSRPPAPGTCR
jgi:hypothetical protein